MASLMDLIMQEYRGVAPASSTLPSFAQGQARPAQPMSIGSFGGQPMMGAFAPSFTQPVIPPAPMRPSPFDETNMAAPSFAPAALAQGATNAPLPPRIPGGQTRGVREPGFFEKLFGGTQYQSNNLPVVMQEQGPMPDGSSIQNYAINFGDPNRAADFFAADRALMQQNPAMFGLLGGSNG